MYKWQKFPLAGQITFDPASAQGGVCIVCKKRPSRFTFEKDGVFFGICRTCAPKKPICEECGAPAVIWNEISCINPNYGRINCTFALCEEHYKKNIVTIDGEYAAVRDDLSETGFGTFVVPSASDVCPVSGRSFARSERDPLILCDTPTGWTFKRGHYNAMIEMGYKLRNCARCNSYTTEDYCVKCDLRQVPASLYHGCREKGDRRVGRTIGIELECEPTYASVKALAKAKIASSCDDHSLRGGMRVEYRSPILSEANVESWCRRFFGLLEANVYNRCGLHIHVGTRDWSWHDAACALIYCAKWQGEFSRMVLPSRAMSDSPSPSGVPFALPYSYISKFCKSLTSSKEGFMGHLYGPADVLFDRNTGLCLLRNKRANDTTNAPRYPGIVNRYWWFNIHGHFNKKAPEIRLHHATTSVDQVLAWVSLWVQLFGKIIDSSKLNYHPLDLVSTDVAVFYKARIQAIATMRNTNTEGVNVLDGYTRRI